MRKAAELTLPSSVRLTREAGRSQASGRTRPRGHPYPTQISRRICSALTPRPPGIGCPGSPGPQHRTQTLPSGSCWAVRAVKNNSHSLPRQLPTGCLCLPRCQAGGGPRPSFLTRAPDESQALPLPASPAQEPLQYPERSLGDLLLILPVLGSNDDAGADTDLDSRVAPAAGALAPKCPNFPMVPESLNPSVGTRCSTPHFLHRGLVTVGYPGRGLSQREGVFLWPWP